MSPDDRIRLRHMVDAIEAAQRFVRGRQRQDLERDEMLLFALVRAVEIVGEAAGKVSAAGRAELPQLPWLQASGMRNRLVHAYFDVDRDILWNTVVVALPALAADLRAAIGSEAPL
jgi:uncharacterized protein with HEPN domain